MDGKHEHYSKGDSSILETPCPYSLSLLATVWTASSDANLWRPQLTSNTLRHGLLDPNMELCRAVVSCAAVHLNPR